MIARTALLALLLALLSASAARGQRGFKWPDIPSDQLAATASPTDPEADAEILLRSTRLTDRVHQGGVSHVEDVHVRIKIYDAAALVYDGQGFWLCHKRLSSGRFRHWPGGSDPAQRLEVAEIQLLLSGGDPAAARTAAEPWRRLKTVG